MAEKKLRGKRGAIPKWTLDATGSHEPPTMSEILSKGLPAEVREFLGGQGALMRAGVPLPAPVAEWLGAALEEIGRGGDANRALRVVAKQGRDPMGVRELAVVERQIDDLVEQGVSRFDAMSIVERYRMALRHDKDPRDLHGRTEEDRAAAAERMKKRLSRTRQGTK
ncbi:MAG: hypothetical protein WCY29_15770 [Novosphingobium sp.]